jgi:teichuronic acid biosynthesis protein TuaE
MLVKKWMSEHVLKFYFILFLQLIIYVVYFFWGEAHNLEAIKDLFYSFSFFIMLSWLYWLVRDRGVVIFDAIFKALFVMLILTSGIVIFELISGIHLPSHSDEPQFALVPTAFFTNPNNLGMITVLIFAFVYFWAAYRNNRLIQVLSVIISTFIILASLSRLSLLLFVAYFFLYQFVVFRLSRIIISGVLLVLILAGSSLLLNNISSVQTDNPVIQRSVERISSVNNLDEQTHSESSVSKRIKVWKNIFSNAEDHLIGHGWGDHKKFLHKEVRVDMNNIHSFILEMIYNVGILGVIPIILFFLLLIIYALMIFPQSRIPRFALIHIILFLFLSNVPSGIIRFSLVWFVMTIPVTLLFLSSGIEQEINAYSDEK